MSTSRVHLVCRWEEWSSGISSGVFRDVPSAPRVEAYQWLRRALALRGQSGQNPAWGWQDVPPAVAWSLWGSPGERLVVVTAEVPEDRVVGVVFLAWCLIVEGSYVAGFGEPERDFHTRAEIEASWYRAFDPEYVTRIAPTVLAIDGVRADEVREVTVVTIPMAVASA